MKVATLIFFVLSPWCLTATAQCATGVSTGGGNCVPPDAPGMPGYDTNKAAQEPQPVWADQWGAIALDSGTGQAGTVTNKNSERDAKNGALGDCGRNGASNCKIMLTYYNQCAAVAFGAGFSSMQSDASLDKAKDTALSRCEAKGASCKIVYTGCSVARRVR